MRQSTPDRPTRSGRRARLAEAKAADSLNALSFRTLAAELNGRMSSRSAGGSSDASGSPPQPARKKPAVHAGHSTHAPALAPAHCVRYWPAGHAASAQRRHTRSTSSPKNKGKGSVVVEVFVVWFVDTLCGGETPITVSAQS